MKNLRIGCKRELSPVIERQRKKIELALIIDYNRKDDLAGRMADIKR